MSIKHATIMRSCRRYARLTQSEVSDKILRSIETLSAWENDLHMPSIDAYEEYLAACGFGIEVVRLEDIEGSRR